METKTALRSVTALAVFMGALCFAAGGQDGSVSQATEGTADGTVIGNIGPTTVTEGEVIKSKAADFDRLRIDYESERRRVELKYAEARHDLLQRSLDERLDRAAVEAEAKVRGVQPAEVLAELKAVDPSEAEVRALYEANKDRIRQPYETVAAQAREYLKKQRNEALTRAFYDKLRAAHDIKASLDVYRVTVASTGPVRGDPRAPITVVEFADFQCPYCQAAEASLGTLLARHGKAVRLVFRNLPLSKIHPNAEVAAEAGICADRQGKFWEMHDAMYKDQRALSLDSLKGTAARLGLRVDRFSSCLTEASTSTALSNDTRDAQALGLEGTPYFFINGRPIDGNAPLDTFEQIIADELQRARGSATTG
jgi:protein-disulfide isomerase